jgi:hypothetical protein
MPQGAGGAPIQGLRLVPTTCPARMRGAAPSCAAQELRALQGLLDRTHYEKSRATRANDPLTAKYQALKQDLRAAAAAAPGGQARAVSPDAVVHAVRAAAAAAAAHPAPPQQPAGGAQGRWS